YYDTWKRLRGIMEKSIKNNNYNIKSRNELDQKFIEFIKSKYANKEIDVKTIKIISEREEFENIK
ncbi:MAG: hypothetical protein K2I70_02690, partial [Bacilli bacterium]|nr:hypothetical protein [Bacilli bacterium]